jgi:translation initiation factor 5B
MTDMLRSPIVTVLGHVDHGKSTLLDKIRGTDVASREAGAITQSIGASKIPIETIRSRTGRLLENMGKKIRLPGLLFIDTPGHAAFGALRQRGGSLADLAIVVVDITEGMQPQTEETIEILRQTNTPFLIAANKVDLIPGFKDSGASLQKTLQSQKPRVQQTLDNKVYELIGSLYEEFELEAERYDRVDDYRNKVAIIPCSAVEGIGIPEILFVLVGLSQRFLSENLAINTDQAGKGVILEVKEEKGMGKTLDTIIYDGYIEESDEIVIGSLADPIVGSIRGLFMPKDLDDSRDEKTEYKSVKKAVAATGVKVLSPQVTDDVVSGMPIRVHKDRDLAALKKEVRAATSTSDIPLEKEGILIHARTLGGLEALATILSEHDIPIRRARIGDISKKALADARSNLETDPVHAVILGFNVDAPVSAEDVKVITSDVIYDLVDRVKDWMEKQQESIDMERLRSLTPPAKFKVLRGCIFRKNDPCIVGIEVLGGVLQTKMYVMDEQGVKIGKVKSIQKENENVDRVVRGEQAAIQLPSGNAEKNVHEEMIMYSDLLEDDFRTYKDMTDLLDKSNKQLLKEIALINRKEYPLWGV